jgi:hypothetical protein
MTWRSLTRPGRVGRSTLSLVAGGGAGKSALLNEWFKYLQSDAYRGAEVVLGWSFNQSISSRWSGSFAGRHRRAHTRELSETAYIKFMFREARVRKRYEPGKAEREVLSPVYQRFGAAPSLLALIRPPSRLSIRQSWASRSSNLRANQINHCSRRLARSQTRTPSSARISSLSDFTGGCPTNGNTY